MSHTTTPPCPNPACQSDETHEGFVEANGSHPDTSFYCCEMCGAQWGLDLGEWRFAPEYGD